MKAKVKSTGQIVDVKSIGRMSVRKSIQEFKSKDGDIFDEDELIFYDVVDWEQRRYEIAKDILSSLVSKINDPFSYRDEDMLVTFAIGFADELIQQLKDGRQ